MAPVAVEAMLTDVQARLREADRRISQLEAEVLRIGSLTMRAPAPTAPMLPALTSEVPWPSLTPVPPAVGAVTPIVPSVTAAASVAPVRSYVPQTAPMELYASPGELDDIPSALNGGRRKRIFGWFVTIVLVLGLGALVVAAIASQSRH
jgi:hypothetical protein